MTELWLTYTDADGSRRRVAVERGEFVVGRHSECDLAIADGRLSRRHARLIRTGTGFEIEDLGSSNGTDLNGTPVFEPVQVRSGDVISFGGVEAVAEIAVREAKPVDEPQPPAAAQKRPAAPRSSEAADDGGGSSGVPLWAIIGAPVMAAVLVLVAGVAVLIIARGAPDVSQNGPEPEDPIESNEPVNKKKQPDDPPANSQAANKTGDPIATDPIGPTPTPANLSQTAKVEINAASFLRKIAQNNPKAFLTGEQAERVAAKIKQISSSSALASNLNSARKNGSQIKTIAAAKNIKPQMLAIASVAKLGGGTGDVAATAATVADVLDKLTIQLGNELADDCLLMIAAYDQGAAGETMKMRNMLQDLATKSSESSRTIRTIWFLQKEGKISQAQFDFALHFLAAGTIAQNPKEFGVNAEALDL